jgi:hypothetical protein
MTEPVVVFKHRVDARVAPKPAAPLASDRSRRRPLGLRPAPDDVGEPEARGGRRKQPPRSDPAIGEPTEFTDPVVALVSQSGELLVGLIDDQRRHFQLAIAKLEARLAETQD